MTGRFVQKRGQKRQADELEDRWVEGEQEFVLEQAKKKAALRVREGRAKPIDYLAVALRSRDQEKSFFYEEEDSEDDRLVDPQSVLDGLNLEQLGELSADISHFATLELSTKNKAFWEVVQTVCDRKLKALGYANSGARGQETIMPEVEAMFEAKSYSELDELEGQISEKLNSRGAIDRDYWSSLLQDLSLWKAKSKLDQISKEIRNSQLRNLQRKSQQEANNARMQLHSALRTPAEHELLLIKQLSSSLDPESALKKAQDDKVYKTVRENDLLRIIGGERSKILQLGYVPVKKAPEEKPKPLTKRQRTEPSTAEKSGQMFEEESSKGVADDEEIFEQEVSLDDESKPPWSEKYRPRKPRYFNRVHMGFEWNKYNQTHYDQDNPPPKTVQGYKFNVFYPDLIDPSRAPTFKIERARNKKKGQFYASAGEEDTCVIRFIAGPPYEDLAFRIVDKEWDYSAKRERGYRSTFEDGILQLHFQFKRIFYRK